MPTDGRGSDAADDVAEDGPSELARMRALVGPNEQSYEDLSRELAQASDAVKEAEAEAGRLRGRITEMQLELHRARQDQFHLQRVALRPAAAIVARLRRLRRQ